MDQLDFVKINNFCTLKDIVKKMEMQVIRLEKMFADHMSNEDLYPDYINNSQDFPGGPVFKNPPWNAGELLGRRVRSLVGQIRSHMPWGN